MLPLWQGPLPTVPHRSPPLLRGLARQSLLFYHLFRRKEWRRLRTRPSRGGGEIVLVLPGLGAADWSTALLRSWLRRAGYDPRPWNLGLHRPHVDRTLLQLLPKVEALAAERAEALVLLGWSLGGIVARELARLRPDLVRGVITLGSPVRGGFRPTAIAPLYRLQGWDPDWTAEQFETVEQVPLRVPVLAILSYQDGIVAWQAAIDARNPVVEHRLATSCHWGLGIDPEIIETICDQLDLWCQAKEG